MKRTFKVLGLALVAVLALSAVIASAASAAENFVAEEAATVSVSSNETQVFTYTAGGAQVKCTGTQVSAAVTTSSPEVTATPSYSGCTGPGGITAHVQFNGGCDFLFTINGQVHVCPGGGTVTIVVTGLCTYHFSAQTVSVVTYDNIGSGTTKEVKLTPEVTGITATNTNPGFLCGPESSTTGTYSGSVTLTAVNSEGKHVGITVD